MPWGGDAMDNGVTRGASGGATRRKILWTMGSAALAAGAPATAAPPEVDARVVARNDAALENLLRAQIMGTANPRLGGVPDEYGMFLAGAAGGLIEAAAASWIAPQSKHHGAGEVLERIRLAAQFLERSQSAEGNIDLLTTNFNSPPDTGFVVHNVGTAAAIAKMYGGDEVVRALRPFLVKAAAGMTTGGIHTPNHRWVARASAEHDFVRNNLLVIQKDLIVLMGELCVQPEDLPHYVKDGYSLVTPEMTAKLDALVREIEGQNVSFKGWATPGATPPGAALDLARTICRRAERRVCGLKESGELKNVEIIIYLNRLSDLLWLFARWVETKAGA